MIIRLNPHFFCNCFAIIIITVYQMIKTTANEVQKCKIGYLGDCPDNYTCVETDSTVNGVCFCDDNCPPNKTVVSTVKPLPIYSDDNNLNNSSVIITSIFGSMFAVLIVFSVYYFGVKKGVFRDIWSRAFTPRQVEHQLLDRSPSNDDNNDSEAIA